MHSKLRGTSSISPREPSDLSLRAETELCRRARSTHLQISLPPVSIALPVPAHAPRSLLQLRHLAEPHLQILSPRFWTSHSTLVTTLQRSTAPCQRPRPSSPRSPELLTTGLSAWNTRVEAL